MKLNLPSKRINVKLFSAVIAALILLAVVTVAYAENTAPLTPIPGLGRVPNETLMRMHNKAISWYNDQAALFNKADALATDFQKWIDAENKKGRDTSVLKDALSTFNDEITAAKAIHTQAGAIIFAVGAWKADGSVRDRLAAGQSLLDGRAALADSKFRLTNGMEVLEKAFWKWRAAIINPNAP